MNLFHFWRPPIAVMSLFAIIAAPFWQTVGDLLGTSNPPGVTTDAPLVVLAVLVLIWNERVKLSFETTKPCFSALAALAVFGFCWLCGQLVFTRVLTQFAVLAMLPLGVLAVFGVGWFKVLIFPFFVLLFALPVWTPLVPALVSWSANVAEVAIRASGVPIFRDGAYFILPSGSWSIADACSGVAFLSTSFLLGILYAWTIYYSPRKRLIFICGATAIGIAGNWVRVYLTIIIAHISDNRLLRDDHYMFGWYLFATFLCFYCWIGWHHRDADAPEQRVCATQENKYGLVAAPTKRATILCAGLAAFFTVSMWPILQLNLVMETQDFHRDPGRIPPAHGWSSAMDSTANWAPVLNGPNAVRIQSFEKSGKRVHVFTGIYETETWNRKLVTASNQLVGSNSPSFSLVSRGRVDVELDGSPLQMQTGTVLGRNQRLLIWHWYAINGQHTGSSMRAKFIQLTSRLRGAQPSSVWLCIYTEASEASAGAEQLLREFLREMGAGLIAQASVPSHP